MARISRKCYESSYYHVMVQGINKEYLFDKDIYKQKYIDILFECASKYKLKVIAYCLMENHAHLLIYTEDVQNLSKLMLSLNTRYGKFFNKQEKRCGYVFRDRYRCENIYTQSHFYNCIRYIHDNPVKANICKCASEYKYSTYNQYLKRTGVVDGELSRLIALDDFRSILKVGTNENFIDVENEFGNQKYEVLENVIKEKDICELNQNEKIEFAIELLKRCKATKKDVAEILNIERTKLSRMIQKQK